MRLCIAIAILIASVLDGGGLYAESVCSSARMVELRGLAQSLDPKTEDLGSRLLECQEFRDDAFIWLAFYLKQQGQYAKLAELQEKMPMRRPDRQDQGERTTLLNEAIKGRYRLLEQAVRQQKGLLHRDVEALLLLARAQVRAGRPADGREHYRSYLLLKPYDEAIEIELAYTWLWEGDKKTANEEFLKLQRKNLSPEGRSSVAAGLRLTEEKEQEERPHLIAGVSLYRTSDPFLRRGYHFGWGDGLWTAMGSTYELEFEEFGEKKTGRATELIASRYFRADHWRLGGVLGIAATSRATMLFDISAQYQSTWQGMMGFARSMLAKYVPLPPEYTATTDDYLYLFWKWRESVSYRFEWHTIEKFEPYQKHHVSVTKNLYAFESSDEAISGRINIKRNQFPRPNPLFYSPYLEEIITAGLGLDKTIIKNVILKATLDLGIIQTTQLSNSSKSDIYEIRQIEALIRYRAYEDLYFELLGSSNSSRREQVSSGYKANFIQLGATWQLPSEGGSRDDK